MWNPARGVGVAAPRVATRGHGARHMRWVSDFSHDSGSIGSLGAGPTKLRGLWRRRAVRRPPKIVAMAQGYASTAYKRGWGCSATCGYEGPWHAPAHRRWGSGSPHDSGSIGSLGAGPMMPRRLIRRRAVRRPPKIVASAHQHAWNPTRGVGATALRCATCCDKARHNRCDSEFSVVPGSTGSSATGTTNWGRVGRHRPAQRRAQERCTNVAWRREGRALWAPTETWCLYHYTGHGQIFWGCQRNVLNATRRCAGGLRTRTRGSQPHLRR